MISREEILKRLSYDPDSGIFRWERGKTGGNKHGKRAGSVKTCKGGYQYRHIMIMGKYYSEHRLAWIIMSDEETPEVIDHKNRDATDNRWENIRRSIRSRNSMNRSMQKNNISGVTGVSWDKGSKRWRAAVEIGGVKNILGYFEREDLDIAAMEVMEFRAENGFDPGHGLEFARYHCITQE